MGTWAKLVGLQPCYLDQLWGRLVSLGLGYPAQMQKWARLVAQGLGQLGRGARLVGQLLLLLLQHLQLGPLVMLPFRPPVIIQGLLQVLLLPLAVLVHGVVLLLQHKQQQQQHRQVQQQQQHRKVQQKGPLVLLQGRWASAIHGSSRLWQLCALRLKDSGRRGMQQWRCACGIRRK
jgi:hypothetical protein